AIAACQPCWSPAPEALGRRRSISVELDVTSETTWTPSTGSNRRSAPYPCWSTIPPAWRPAESRPARSGTAQSLRNEPDGHAPGYAGRRALDVKGRRGIDRQREL